MNNRQALQGYRQRGVTLWSRTVACFGLVGLP